MNITKPQTVIGIDPGFATIGWGVIEHNNSKLTTLGYGAITTSAKDDFGKRLVQIHVELEKILTTYKPDTAAVEQLFFAKNTTTALQVAHARGIILLNLQLKKIHVREFTPLQLKNATASYGRATKNQVQIMMQRILNLTELPTPDDAADGLALAWLGGGPNKQY